MRVIKSLCLFGGLAWMISACFESPEYPNTPKIAFESVILEETSDNTILTLAITFQDGDGDLGLPDDGLDPRYEVAPYNRFTYAIKTKVAGGFEKGVVPLRFTADDAATYKLEALDVIRPSFANYGHILSDKDLDEEAYYNSMPAYVYPFSCINYTSTSIYVLESDNLVDASFDITDTTVVPGDRIFKVVGRFYKESNPNTANINIVFEYIPEDDGDNDPTNDNQWRVFDWTKDSPDNTCAPSFNGRFPVLTADDGSLDGIIRYHMKSKGFYETFNSSEIRLRVTIRDRSLNVSNEIVTPPFTLNGIKQ